MTSSSHCSDETQRAPYRPQRSWSGWKNATRDGSARPNSGRYSGAFGTGVPCMARNRRCSFLRYIHRAREAQNGFHRRRRRTTRLRRASRLAPGKTWDTFQHQRLPARLQQQLGELGARGIHRTGDKRAGLRIAWHREDPTPCAPWATGWWKPDTRSSLRQPIA